MDVRSRHLLEDIRDQHNRLLSCGDVRAAILLKNKGFIRLIHPKNRQYILAYTLTIQGEQALG